MDASLNRLLRKHKVKGATHTHVSMGKVKGCFYITNDSRDAFWKEYSSVIDDTPEGRPGIAETSQDYMPVLADIDIKLREGSAGITPEGIHTRTHVMEVMQAYQETLKSVLAKGDDSRFACLVLEKDPYTVSTNGYSYVKHGFHLHFPNCFLSKIDMQVHVFPRIKARLKALDTFADIGIEDSSTVIDDAVCRNPWLLYGSAKKPEMDPYVVTGAFDQDRNEIKLSDALKDHEVYDSRGKPIPIMSNLTHHLPRILSIVPYERPIRRLKSGLVAPLRRELQKRETKKKASSTYQSRSSKEQIATAKKLVPLLSDARCSDYDDWMRIGWALWSINEGCSDGLDLWCQFSSRDKEKYNEAVCVHTWSRMKKKKDGVTLGTIVHYAKLDNPEGYAEIVREKVEIHLKDALSGSHYDIAKALHAKYGNEFVCASIQSRAWFQFTDHRWEPIEDGVFLRRRISEEFIQEYKKQANDLIGKLSTATDKGEQEMYNTRLKQIMKMMANLKSSPFKSNVMKECMEVFYDKRFRERLDTNPYLFPFKNGVYDLKTNVFRDGLPEDFISKTAAVNYNPTLTVDAQSVQDVFTYLEKVFPDKSVRQYFMDVSSDLFLGGNHQKHVYFWTGEGDNAKSVTQNIFEKMLGKLAIKFNTTVITGKKVQSGSANPELARAGGGVRLATLEEPNNDEMINIGILKNLSGNDSYYARDLFEKGKEGREITPMFKLVFICNKLPNLKHSDKAVWNRIRVIPFESTFCRPDNPAPESYEEQLRQKRFPMDPNFGKKIPGMLEAFAWVLIQHQKNLKDGDRVEPPKVTSATLGYKQQNDIYQQFNAENLVKAPGRKVSLNEIYAQFKEWFRDSLPHRNLPIKNEVGEHYARIWGEPGPGKRWAGWRLRTDVDNQDDTTNGVSGAETAPDFL